MKNLIKLFVFIIVSLVVFSGIRYSNVQAAESDAVTQVRASHILVDTKEEANLIKEAIDGGAGFSTMARKYSKCPSAQNGGDLGYFERGQMVQEFEDVAFALPVGKVSKPVKTQFGWHLIRVTDKK